MGCVIVSQACSYLATPDEFALVGAFDHSADAAPVDGRHDAWRADEGYIDDELTPLARLLSGLLIGLPISLAMWIGLFALIF